MPENYYSLMLADAFINILINITALEGGAHM
jgi:hypothetical protein